MTEWQSVLHYDPIPALVACHNEAVVFFTKRDLLGSPDVLVSDLWVLPEAQRIVRKQSPDGSWHYPGGHKKVRSAENYNQLETFRNLGYLIEMYGFNRSCLAIAKAADIIFGFQTVAGDIRGILGNQYAPYYTAALLELLIKAGYGDDERIDRAFIWLAGIRQRDGGWAIPFRTRHKQLEVISLPVEPYEPDRLKPFSHMVTGVVLRSYAAHPQYKHSAEAKQAGKLLLSSLFQRDSYPDRNTPDYWLRFTFPFWFTDLISALDSLSLLGFKADEPQIVTALDWLVSHQQPTGLWELKILKNNKQTSQLWLSLAICRILKRFYQ